MNIFDYLSWWWQQLGGVLRIVFRQQWGELTWQHVLACLLLCGLVWCLRPVLWRLWLLKKFKGQIRNKRWHFARVLNVVDGDTLNVKMAWSRTVKVRMQYIDAPESKQRFGEEATRFLQKQTQGKTVLLVCAPNHDRYGRILAEVFTLRLRHSVNLTMVEHGMAWAYQGTKMYVVAEQTARRKKLGLWRGRKPTQPAEWRKEKNAG